MKVQELINVLILFDPDDEVILAKDVEGNSYSPLYDFQSALYVPDSKNYGDIYIRELTDELRAEGYDEDDATDSEDAVPAIVLWPSN